MVNAGIIIIIFLSFLSKLTSIIGGEGGHVCVFLVFRIESVNHHFSRSSLGGGGGGLRQSSWLVG